MLTHLMFRTHIMFGFNQSENKKKLVKSGVTTVSRSQFEGKSTYQCNAFCGPLIHWNSSSFIND